MNAACLALAVAALIACTQAGIVVPSSGAASAEITDLPGAPKADFKQYSGYVTVDKTNGRKLFYWFTESARDPMKDPLVLWLNGGPGCSSLGGLLTEQGPWRPTKGGVSLERNEHSWNNVANMIFLESPAGVGFSYSDTKDDYTVGDARAADDVYNFLLGFLELHPEFKDHPFWVSGESYGGHYVPTTTARIVAGNKAGGATKINLQGFLAGNAWTDATLDNKGAVFMWYTHALNSRSTYDGLMKNCDFGDIGPLRASKGDTKECKKFQKMASAERGNVNIYDIYQHLCLEDEHNQATMLISHLADSDSPVSTIFQDLNDRIEAHMSAQRTSGALPGGHEGRASPCIGKYAKAYLNRADVQTAIHATKLPYEWSDCSPRVNYSRKDLLTSVIPVYRDLIQEGLSINVFSGDVDGIVPVTGTRMWLESLDLTPKNAWRPWMLKGEVGGYVEGFKELTFYTIRDAGHMVPGTQPARALKFFDSVVNHKDI